MGNCNFMVLTTYSLFKDKTTPMIHSFASLSLNYISTQSIYFCDSLLIPAPSLLPFSPQRLCRLWKERSAMRSSSPRLTARCPPSSSRERLWRTPTPTLKCSRTWASLPRPWSLPMKTCKSEKKDSVCCKSLERLWGIFFVIIKYRRFDPCAVMPP